MSGAHWGSWMSIPYVFENGEIIAISRKICFFLENDNSQETRRLQVFQGVSREVRMGVGTPALLVFFTFRLKTENSEKYEKTAFFRFAIDIETALMNLDGSGRSWCWTLDKQNAARVLKKIDFINSFNARSYWQNSDLFRRFPAFFEECRFWGVPIFLGSQNGRNKMKKGQKVASRTCSETRDADFSKNVVFLWKKRVKFVFLVYRRCCTCCSFRAKPRNR